MKKLLYACTALVMALTTATALAADFYRHLDRSNEWRPGRLPTHLHLQAGRRQADWHGAGRTGRSGRHQRRQNRRRQDLVQGRHPGGTTITHEGTINAAGDEIKLTSKSDNGQFPGGEMTLKRAKAPAPPPTRFAEGRFNPAERGSAPRSASTRMGRSRSRCAAA